MLFLRTISTKAGGNQRETLTPMHVNPQNPKNPKARAVNESSEPVLQLSCQACPSLSVTKAVVPEGSESEV